MEDHGEKAAKQLGEMTECPICKNVFNNPRMLPCIHTFCFECLERTAEAAEKQSGDRMPCPLCRKNFTIPANGVTGLQKNFFMENLLEFHKTLQIGSTFITCDMCNVRNEGEAREIPNATMRCLKCQDNYCDSCVKVHKLQKLMRNHLFVKISSEVASEMKRSFTTMYCTEHTQKLLDYYCFDCKKVVCVSCFVESHASHKCKDVTKVDEEFRQAIQRNTSKVSICAEEMLSLRKNSEIRKADFLKVISVAENSVCERNQVLKDMIEEHTKSLLGELSKGNHLKEMETGIQEIDRQCTILRSFQEYCTKLVSGGSPNDICNSVDQLIVRAGELGRDHKAFIGRPHQSVKISFQLTDLSETLQKSNNILGQIKDSLSLGGNLVKGEESAITAYIHQNSAMGYVIIAECSADGKFIVIKNTGREKESLGGWSLKRNIDGSEKCDFKMASDFVLRPRQKIKLWARDSKPSNAPAYDIETDQMSFGSGDVINTRLVNQSGEERATHFQKAIYT